MTYFLAVVLCVWRLSSLVASERGPFDIFERLRQRAGKCHAQLDTLLRCVWCNSAWLGFLFALLIADNWDDWFVYSMAISAGAIVVNELITMFERIGDG